MRSLPSSLQLSYNFLTYIFFIFVEGLNVSQRVVYLRRAKKIKQTPGPQNWNKILPSCWNENILMANSRWFFGHAPRLHFFLEYAFITGRLEATRTSFTHWFGAELALDSRTIVAGLALPKSSKLAGSRLLAARDFLPALRAGRSFVTRSQRQLRRTTSARSVKPRLACGMLRLAVAS